MDRPTTIPRLRTTPAAGAIPANYSFLLIAPFSLNYGDDLTLSYSVAVAAGSPYWISAVSSDLGDTLNDSTLTASYNGTVIAGGPVPISLVNTISVVDTVTVGDGNTGYFGNTFDQTIPEPASLAVLGLGLAGLGLVRRRRHA